MSTGGFYKKCPLEIFLKKKMPAECDFKKFIEGF
jgi:hypothetical protein